MSKTYKYYVKGKPKTFDLKGLTNEELTKFKNMDNIERLRFIEIKQLEKSPLFETYDIKTTTKYDTDTNKAYKKDYDLYKSTAMKSKLDKYIKNGKDLFKPAEGDELIFNDEVENDLKFTPDEKAEIVKKYKEGYNDITKLRDYYVNVINTLNVDTVENLKAKEIRNLEAATIKLNDTKSLIDAINKVFPKETIKKITEGIEKGDIPESVGEAVISDDIIKTIEELIKNGKTELADNIKKYFDELVKVVETKTGSTITKEEFNEILKNSELKEALISEINKSKDEVKDEINKIKDINKLLEHAYDTAVQLQGKNLSYDDILKETLPLLDTLMEEYSYDYRQKKRQINYYLDNGKTNVKEENKIDYPDFITSEERKAKTEEERNKLRDERINKNLDKYLGIIYNADRLPELNGENKIPIIVRMTNQVLKQFKKLYSKYDEFNDLFEKGEGVEKQSFSDQSDEDSEIEECGTMKQSSCGKFLNRFKDYSSDIERLTNKTIDLKGDILSLKGNVKDIYNELKDLNEKIDKAVSLGDKSLKEVKQKPEAKAERNQGFLKDIINKPSLKHVEEDEKKEPEKSDLMKVMEKRRKDIEPDEYDDLEGSEDWAAGMNTVPKVIKFKALMKYLN